MTDRHSPQSPPTPPPPLPPGAATDAQLQPDAYFGASPVVSAHPEAAAPPAPRAEPGVPEATTYQPLAPAVPTAYSHQPAAPALPGAPVVAAPTLPQDHPVADTNQGAHAPGVVGAPSLPSAAPAPPQRAQQVLPPAFDDPTVLNRKPENKRSVGARIVRRVFGLILLVALAAGGYVAFGYYQDTVAEKQFPAVTAEHGFESATFTYNERSGFPEQRSWTVQADVNSGMGTAESSTGQIYWGERGNWYEPQPNGDGRVSGDHDVARAIGRGIRQASSRPTIDSVLPEEVRPFVTILEVERVEVHGRSLRRFVTVLDARSATAEAAGALRDAERFWGDIEFTPTISDVSIIVWVDDDGLVWGWSSVARDEYGASSGSISYRLVSVSDQPYAPDYPDWYHTDS